VSERIERSIRRAEAVFRNEEHTLNVGVFDGIDTATFLPAFTGDFRRAHPNITLNYERNEFRPLREKLLRGALDVIVTLGFETEEAKDFAWVPLYESRAMIILSKDHPLAAREHVAVADLAGCEFAVIAPEMSQKGREHLLAICAAHGFRPKIAWDAPTDGSLLMTVETGRGVTIMHESVRMVARENFRTFVVEGDTTSVAAVWKKGTENPAVPVFVQALAKHFHSETE